MWVQPDVRVRPRSGELGSGGERCGPSSECSQPGQGPAAAGLQGRSSKAAVITSSMPCRLSIPASPACSTRLRCTSRRSRAAARRHGPGRLAIAKWWPGAPFRLPGFRPSRFRLSRSGEWAVLRFLFRPSLDGGLDEFVEFSPTRRLNSWLRCLSSSRSASSARFASASSARSLVRRSISRPCRLHVASRSRTSASALDVQVAGFAAISTGTSRESYRLRLPTRSTPRHPRAASQ